ncbi:hypothetical protein QFZ63_001689 [Streptomyces sp. B3I7]|nr:hypothetical protein [Streptomyces sp. B3I7]
MHRPPQVRVSGTPARQPWPGPASGHRARSRVRRPAPSASLRSTAGGVAVKTDEYVPTTMPMSRAGAKSVRVPPPGTTRADGTVRTATTGVEPGLAAGARVPVWTDAAGDVVSRRSRSGRSAAGPPGPGSARAWRWWCSDGSCTRRARGRCGGDGSRCGSASGSGSGAGGRPGRQGTGGPRPPAAPGSPGAGRRRKKIPRRGTRIPIPPSFRSEAARRTPPAPRGLRHGRGTAGRRPRARLMPSAARRTVGVSAGTEASARGRRPAPPPSPPVPAAYRGRHRHRVLRDPTAAHRHARPPHLGEQPAQADRVGDSLRSPLPAIDRQVG